jgi:thiol-disulfide isomerase/thioredoxin
MHILHIHSEKDVDKIDEMIEQGKDVFILVYMEGCGPCNATRPEWAKLESALKNQYANMDDLVVIDINKDFISKVKHIGSIDGFPTMKYIGNNGKMVENYEDSRIRKKDRSVNSFINWIETKINKMVSTSPTSSVHDVFKRISKTRKRKTKRTQSMRGGKRIRGVKKRRQRKWSKKI